MHSSSFIDEAGVLAPAPKVAIARGVAWDGDL